MRAPPTAVLFDFDHTLGVDNRLEERVLRLLAQRLCGVDPPDGELATALARFRTGMVTLAEMLHETFGAWGYAGDVVHAYKGEALLLLPELLVPMPGAKEMLQELEGLGNPVAILTNGWTELQYAKASLLGFEGAVFVSEEIGAWKPDARAFEIACGRLGVPMSTSLYVGDSPLADVSGAKGAGMLTVWANLDGMSYPRDVAAPDFTIATLAELPPLVLTLGG
jgi:putative hydrolase of the HAD superfamily